MDKGNQEKNIKWVFFICSLISILSGVLCFFPPKINLEMTIKNVEGTGSILVYKTENYMFREYYSEWYPIDSETQSLQFSQLHYDLECIRIDIDGVHSVEIVDITICSPHKIIRFYEGSDLWCSIDASPCIVVEPHNDSVRFIRQPGEDAYIVFERTPLLSKSYLVYYFMIRIVVSAVIAGLLDFFGNARKNIHVSIAVASTMLVTLFCLLINESIGVISSQYLFLTFAIHFAILLIAISFFGIRIGAVISNLTISLVFIMNYYVELFRGRSLLLSDFNAIGTALDVASEYELKLNSFIVILIVLNICLAFANVIYRNKLFCFSFFERVLLLLVALIMAVCVHSSILYKEASYSAWDSDIIFYYKNQGVLLSMTKYFEEYRVKKPQKYSEGMINSIKSKYSKNYSAPPIINTYNNQPDIVLVIMNESFCKVEDFNEDLDFSTTPFLDSITENIVKGNLYVSVRGGGTCNTEFESLTGLSMAYLPFNTYPFQSFIQHDLFSISSFYASNGYEISSLHLAERNNWNRSIVYRRLGLYPFYSIEDYALETADTVRGYATDSYNYKVLTELAEEMSSTKKFLFNVSIQNHGGYTLWKDLEKLYDFSSFGYYPEAEEFCSLMSISDSAIKELVNYYKDSKEKTMIVIFGDHQPNLGSNADEWMMKDDNDPLKMYRTPFYIITNYPIESKNIGCLSANYIPYLIAQASGYELTPFLKMLGAIYDEIPVLTQYGIIDKNNVYYESIDLLPDNKKDLLLEYEIVQYDILFGNNYLSLS